MSTKTLTLRIPGSTSNLGPGFDTLGLALSIYSEFTFDLLDRNDASIPLVKLRGDIAQGLADDRSNLAYATLANLWQDRPDLLDRVRLTIKSDIPLARGLGSSSTAILAATWASYVLAGKLPDRHTVLSKATAIEGHPDNLAASLHGGLVICSESFNHRHVITEKLQWPEQWHTILVVPRYQLSTHEARAVLPRQLGRRDAVISVQRVALLLSAVVNKDESAFQEALHDRLHEPYREHLVPELRLLRRYLRGTGALGCVLSGAGPSILVIANRRSHAHLLEHLKEWAAEREHPPEVLDLRVDQQGLKEVHASVRA